jgi:hypothetical protein
MAKANGTSRRSERLRRPEIGRTDPVRKWETLFGPPADDAGPPDPPRGSTEKEATNPITRGVELGYRVMDEYVRQGARVAGLRGGSATSSGTTGTGLPQLTERMFQYASDFASVWLEAMGVMMRNGGAAGEGPAPVASNGAAAAAVADPPGDPRPASANGRSAHQETSPRNGTSLRNGTISLAVEVASRRPVQASIDLRPGSIDGPMVVQDLRSRDPRRPRLKGIVLEAAPGGKQLTLRLKVANRHPAGEYVGAIVDQSTGVTRGTLTVTIDRRIS